MYVHVLVLVRTCVLGRGEIRGVCTHVRVERNKIPSDFKSQKKIQAEKSGAERGIEIMGSAALNPSGLGLFCSRAEFILA